MSDESKIDIYAPVIAELQARIDALQATINNLESLRNGGAPTSAPNATRHHHEAKPEAFKNDSFFGMTAADASKKYLGAMKKTQTVGAISSALLAGGWMTTSKNVPDLLRTILSRHASFVRINGEFGLAEWYPGRKSGKRTGEVVAMPSGEIVEDPEIDEDAIYEAEKEAKSLENAEKP